MNISDKGPYDWGNLEWTADGEQIRYGRDEWGKGVGQPFWCSVNLDGTGLFCELLP